MCIVRISIFYATYNRMTINILFACHCKSEYQTKNPLVREWRRCKDRMGFYVACSHPTIEWESSEPIGDMQWIDPDPICPQDSQQYHIWSAVPVAHYDIVWSMYCSVYEHLTTPTRSVSIREHVKTFYHAVWEALKPGGIFVVSVDTRGGVSLEEQDARSREMLLPELEDRWDVVLVPLKSLPFVVKTHETHALVFTKPLNIHKGGLRRRPTRRTHRNKTNRNNKRTIYRI